MPCSEERAVKLYNLDHSPYATRVRMQIRKKGLDIAFEAPPVALRTPEFNERFPMGKIPVLELDDGSQLPDSWVIMEYLEDVMPAISLRPEGATPRAHMQLLARYSDTYLSPSGLFPLFQRVGQPGGFEDAGEQLAALDAELARLQRLLEYLPACRERNLHLGDIALAPAMDYVHLLAPMFGVENPTAGYPLVADWWQWVLEDEAVSLTSGEMRGAVAKFFGS
jgi:glutathione S-transferase